MNALAIILAFLVVVLLIALAVILVIALRSENPFKPAFASLIGTLVLWVGHLNAPDLEGKVELKLDLRPVFSVQGSAARISTKIRFETECLAIASLLASILICAKGLRERANPRP